MLTMPEQIKIGGLVYEVKVVEELADGCAGIIEYKKQIIRIEKSTPDMMGLTLMHEILHALNAEFAEPHIEFMAQALYQIIKENPMVFQQVEVPKEKKKHGKPRKNRS